MREKLLKIQIELKAPKNQKNTFGNYNYRSCEDILEAVKPLCLKYNCCLTISDDIIQVGDRIYVKATAIIADNKNEPGVISTPISVTAFAREQIAKYNKEGKETMDHAQLTGSASSYARKYALNGLFLIDDTKDADFHNDSKPASKKEEKEHGNQKAILEIINKTDTIKALDLLVQQRTVKSWTEAELKEQNDAMDNVREFIMLSKTV